MGVSEAPVSEQYPRPLHHLASHEEWSLLLKQRAILNERSLKEMYRQRKHDEFSVEAAEIRLNYVFQPLNKEVLFLLTTLFTRFSLPQRIDDLFSGRLVNFTEKKPALHTALRASQSDSLWLNQCNILELIHATRVKMEEMAESIRQEKWLGATGLPITDVVNIGIGGSDLGPKLAISALKKYVTNRLSFHFISDSDPDSFDDVVDELNPETTLFIVVSKSFTTQETLLNFKKALHWLNLANFRQHVVAVTAHVAKAEQYGIEYILPIWEWIGGRYSFFSAVNFSLMIAIGPQSFQQLLQGGREMDTHFKTTPFERNLPVLLALTGIWNLNFIGAKSHLFLVYSKRLQHFMPYIQQLDMESNGKSADRQKKPVEYTTGPIIWGGLGNHAEHAYYQLLYEGSHYVSGDFLFINESRYEAMNQAGLKKLTVLAHGLEERVTLSKRHGQAGINQIFLNQLNPYTLGALIALYEHKVYCQSVIWNINAFDQPGIEAAKRV